MGDIVNMKNSGLRVRLKFGEMLELPENNRNSNAASETTSCSLNSPTLTGFTNFDDEYYNSSPSTTSSPHHNSNNNNVMSPWSSSQASAASPYLKSPWIKLSPYPHPTFTNLNNHSNPTNIYLSRGKNSLIGSLLREDGHVYSLAAKHGMLFTGSDSKNIRVWRNFHDVGGFKSGSGLVKAIVTSTDIDKDMVFTGHQDGKIRVWNSKGKQLSTLPTLGDYLMTRINPKKEVIRRHFDAVSCMSLNEETGLLYSGSWDKSIKVWKVSNGKCVESIELAHDDAINSIVIGFNKGLLFSGSADGTVKAWRRELDGNRVRHIKVKTLLMQENAVTSLAVSEEQEGVYLYAGSSDGMVNFWEREKEEISYGGVLRGHKMGVLCLATAGRLVLSGSADKSICVWKREQSREAGGGVHSCLAVLTGHEGPVKCLAVEQEEEEEEEDEDEDGNEKWLVYSGSLDKCVKIWRVPENVPDDELTY